MSVDLRQATAPGESSASAACRELSQAMGALDDIVVATGSDDHDELLDQVLESRALEHLMHTVLALDVYDPLLGQELKTADALPALPALRRLRTALSTPLAVAVGLLHQISAAFSDDPSAAWQNLAAHTRASNRADRSLLSVLRDGSKGPIYGALGEHLIMTDPHAVYPTSPYRWSDGHVVSSADDLTVEAVMTSRTFTSIRVAEQVLDPRNRLLADLYAPIGRCVALVDTNVETHHGSALRAYFAHHGIELELLVYRAMEVDKGIGTVERMLGDFKRVGVSRVEPVLIAGGGVLADTGGLACSLYHRNTPYVMLSTSLVAGIDAGPSPRTCCDGFGYKNLFGAYHPPVLSITDRTFFSTMRKGWLRHGVAEIIKMAVVADEALFAELELAGPELVQTRFGTTADADDDLAAASQRIIAAAMRSYVEAEYGNLYETHQCRPHAYGHTWSPGFEIAGGLLHGHAVAIGMGFGAALSHRLGWIDQSARDRVLALISGFGLSLWSSTLEDRDLVWEAQKRIVQKRGGHLVAPLPQGDVGSCGYLDSLSRRDLDAAMADYRSLVTELPNAGIGIEPLCSDVGLEDPSTVAAPQRAPLAT